MMQARLLTRSTPSGANQATAKLTRRNANGFVATFTLQFTLGFLIIGMVVALLLTTTSQFGSDAGGAMAAVLGASALMAFFGLSGMSGQRLPTGVWVLMACISLSGVPGIALNPVGAVDKGLPFLILLIIRNYVCFFAIPLSLAAKRTLLERSLFKWALAVAAIISVGTMLAAGRAGISLQSAGRLNGVNNAWINVNTVAMFCAFGLLVCVMATFLSRFIRIVVAVPALYCLLLTQSRTAIVTLILSVATYLVLSYRKRKAVGIAIATTALLLTGLFWVELASLRSIPQVNALVERFGGNAGHGDDLRAGVIQHGLDVWYQRPIFGLGFNADDSRFENGYLSLACESGAVGLLLYLGFIALVLNQIRRLLKTQEGTRSYTIGVYLLCTTVFILVHAMGERSHGFQIGSEASNIWAMLVALGYAVPLSGQKAARKGVPWYVRSNGAEIQFRVPLQGLPGRLGPVR